MFLWENAGWGDSISAHIIHKASGVVANQYVNKIPVYGTNTNYVVLKSSDTALIPAGYVLRLICNNNSDTVWRAAMSVVLHREITV
jgi:hypothetical protein